LLSRLLTTLVALALVLASGATALAQDATPAASPVAGGAGPQVGDAVVLFTGNGDEEAQVAVTDIVDPFEEVESDAQRGFHYVMAEVVVENLSDAPYDFNPYLMTVVDGEGFSYQATFASRTSEAAAAQPDFQPGTLEPGQSASGVLFFEVVDGAEVELIVYADSFERFTVLVDQRADVPAEGDPVPVYDAQGDEVGTIAVDQIVTGLEETDNDLSVDRGQTAVAVVLTAEATGDGTLVSPANGLRIVDEFGVSYFPYFAFRSEESMAQLPDFPGEDIEGGATATGAVIFALPTDAVVTYVLYQPEFTKLTIVAQPGEGSVVSGDELEPVAVPTGEATEEPLDDPADEPLEDETPAALTGDCADLQAWVDATGENLSSAEDVDIFTTDEFVADDLRENADLLRELADAQADIETPEIAEEAQESVISFLNVYADLLDEGADSLDDGVPSDEIFADAFTEGPFVDAATSYSSVAAELETACPDVNFEAVA
jgi:hypothetical protein